MLNFLQGGNGFSVAVEQSMETTKRQRLSEIWTQHREEFIMLEAGNKVLMCDRYEAHPLGGQRRLGHNLPGVIQGEFLH